ncbi:MAG: amino acid adenylation domain-containing protein [Hormoscilla sp. GUM202]|nr:amino acid adenylation domain-containing protein [Hormoscilla sp. GUM202]
MSTVQSFSTSQIQQASWFLYKFNPTGLADKISIAVRSEYPVDIKTVKRTMEELTYRHPVLRSRYYEGDGEVMQEVRENDASRVAIEEIDASGWKDEDVNENLLHWVKKPFNLESGSVFRACLFGRSETENIILLTLHQIAGDGESLLTLLQEFVTIYESRMNGDRPPLSPLELSYRDYVQQEIDFLNGSQGKEAGDYWQQKLRWSELPILELPTSYSRPPLRTYNGSSVKMTINTQLSKKIRQLANARSATVAEVLLAVYKVLLYRYTGEEDILVGLLWQSRESQPLFKQVVGNLTNVRVTRDAVSGNRKFTEILTQVRETIQETERSKYYPFALLVKQVKSADMSRPPICQAAFGYRQVEKGCSQNPSIDFEIPPSPDPPKPPLKRGALKPPLSQGGVWGGSQEQQMQTTPVEKLCLGKKLEYYELPEQRVDFELSLEMREFQESLEGDWKYNSDVLAAATVEKIAAHFQNLLAAIVENPETPVDKLPMLSDGEQQQILREWNNSKTDYPQDKCIHQLFSDQVEKTPDALAVVWEDQNLTYSQLHGKANQLAHYLQRLGVGPEVPVAICVERSLWLVVGLLGILKAGGAYVPLDPSYPSERLAYMLADAAVPVLLTQESLVASLPDHPQALCLDSMEGAIGQCPTEELTSGVKPENLGYIIYTSGSTGKPKGVALSQKALVNLILWQQQEAIIGQGARTLQFSPISFDVSFQEIFSTWCSGGTLVLISQAVRRDSFALMQFMAQHKVERLFLPFVALQQLATVARSSETLPPLREIITAGEQLQVSPDLVELMNRLPNCRLQNQYGPSESHVVSAYTLQGPAASWPRRVPIGRPIANSQLYILNRDLQPVPIGVLGELHIGGVCLANGYLNRPELTAAKFIPDPFRDPGEGRLYKTGDMARYLPDGNIEFLGRIDNQVKIRGFRIEIGEIETTLSQHPTVKETVVVVREDNPGNKCLVAYIVPESKSETAPQIVPELKQYLKEKLAEYMVPSAFVLLPQLPLTPSGKVNRRGLPAPDISSFAGTKDFVPPRDRIEEQLAEIWSEILNLNPVGVKDNFFELGGHSLLAVKLMAKIQSGFGKQLPLATLFTNPTIADLGKIVREEKKISSSSLVPLQTQGTKLPFFCVHPAGGHVFYYRELSRDLGSEQPFYGLQAQGFNEGEQVFTKVEDMADFYVKTMQEFQPEGPYQIGGYSFGGVVAFEMAQQLVARGEEVSLLALLDPWVPILLDPNKKIDNLYMRGVLSRYFGGMFGRTDLVTEDELSGLNSEDQIEFIINKAERLGLFPEEATREQNRRFVDVIIGTLKATYTYKRRPYPGKVTVFRAGEKHPHGIDPQLVWVEMYAILDVGEMEVVMVPGNHFTFIKEANINVLAEKLSMHLT